MPQTTRMIAGTCSECGAPFERNARATKKHRCEPCQEIADRKVHRRTEAARLAAKREMRLAQRRTPPLPQVSKAKQEAFEAILRRSRLGRIWRNDGGVQATGITPTGGMIDIYLGEYRRKAAARKEPALTAAARGTAPPTPPGKGVQATEIA